MRKLNAMLAAVGAVAFVTASLTYTPAAVAADQLPDEKGCKANKPKDAETQGWCVAINRRKGNCLACHAVTTKKQWPSKLPPGGNIAPPLVAMKSRFPDKAKLRAQVWDATIANKHSVMPPFGKHKLLSEKEIDLVVEWLHSI